MQVSCQEWSMRRGERPILKHFHQVTQLETMLLLYQKETWHVPCSDHALVSFLDDTNMGRLGD